MPRSIWTGSISFGLVNIPIRMFPAIREHDVHFHQLAPDGSRIHNQRVSEKTGRKVKYEDVRRGYEVSRGKFVVMEPGELDSLTPRANKVIEIEDFVPLADIDPIFYERTYHVAPTNEAAAKAYALLAAVMDERDRVGIGTLVMRQRQHLAAVRPYGKGLALSTMLFGDEVVAQSDVPGVPSRRPTVGPKEKRLATQILDSLAADWDPKRYHDTYEEQLHEILRAKSKGKVIEPEEPAPSAQVIDLMEALQASLDSGSGRQRGPARRTRKATKKRAKKRATKRPVKQTRKKAARRSA